MRGCVCVTANADAPGLTAFLTGLAPDQEPGCGVRVMGTVLQCHRRHRTHLRQVPISTVNEGVSLGGPNSCSGTQARLEDVAGGQQLRPGGGGGRQSSRHHAGHAGLTATARGLVRTPCGPPGAESVGCSWAGPTRPFPLTCPFYWAAVRTRFLGVAGALIR